MEWEMDMALGRDNPVKIQKLKRSIQGSISRIENPVLEYTNGKMEIFTWDSFRMTLEMV